MSPFHGPLQDDRNKYEDGPKRSSSAKDMTILEIPVLTPDWRMAWIQIKTVSDVKCYNCKVVRLVKTVDFDIKIVLIRGRMQKLQPKLCAAALPGRIIRTGDQTIWPGAKKLNQTTEAKIWSRMIWFKSRMIRVKAGQSGKSSGRPDKFFCCRL